MPLEARDIGNLDEQPLASDVLEAGLDNPEFHSARWMNENFGQAGESASPEFSVHALAKVNDTRPDCVPPTLVTQTEFRVIEWESTHVLRISGVANETACRVCIQPDHEEECEMVSVPEGLEALVANLPVGRAVHEEQAEQHEVARDPSGLRVVDIECGFNTDL